VYVARQRECPARDASRARDHCKPERVSIVASEVTASFVRPETVGQLAREVANVRYIKDMSADLAQAGQLIHNHGDVISTFVGWDSLMLAGLTEGAAGVMAGTANVMPAQLVSIYRAVCDGELERAQSEWARIYPLMDAFMSAPFVPAIKSALNALGFPAGSPRKPVLDLDATTAATIACLAGALPQLSTSR
jgi:4-hydroxy-tetrahydrodipicolinate synthase